MLPLIAWLLLLFGWPSSLILLNCILYMKGQRESAIIELLGQIGLLHPPKLFEDLYNGIVLNEAFLTMVSEQTQAILNFRPLPQYEQDIPYQQQKERNLMQLLKNIRSLAEQHNEPLKKHISVKKIAYQDDQDQLFQLIRSMISVLTNQRIIVPYFTRLSGQAQTFFMKLLQQDKEQHRSDVETLLTKIEELEVQLQDREQAYKQLASRMMGLQEENQSLNREIVVQKTDVEELRKKTSEYEELEHIFEKKDAELKNLNDIVQELRLNLQKEKIANKDLTQQAEAAVNQLKQELARQQDNPQTDKLRRKLESSQKALGQITVRMKDEKNVLGNLKQRCMTLEETVKALQNDKMELVLQISEREEEKKRLLQRLQQAQSRHRKDLQEKEQFARSMKDSHRQPLGMELNYQFKTIAETSIEYCTNVQCQKAKEDSKTYHKRCVELAQKLQKFASSGLAESQKARLVDDYTSKITALNLEISKLKQKLQGLSSNATGYYEDAVAKLKKKNNILKKRIEEDEDKRGKEIATLTSVILELQMIIQDNIPNSRIVEILRRLK